MKQESITKAIEDFKYLGVQMKTTSDEVGWYLIFKFKIDNNFFEKYSEIVDEYFINEQIKRKKFPYTIVERKVTTSFFLNNSEINDDSDYVSNNVYNFSTLEEVLNFFYVKNYILDDFIWLAELKYVD